MQAYLPVLADLIASFWVVSTTIQLSLQQNLARDILPSPSYIRICWPDSILHVRNVPSSEPMEHIKDLFFKLLGSIFDDIERGCLSDVLSQSSIRPSRWYYCYVRAS